MSETIMRQFYISKGTGLTVLNAEQCYQVEIRPLDNDTSQLLFEGRLIAIEGEHDNVYRLFDKLCPGMLSDSQRHRLGLC